MTSHHRTVVMAFKDTEDLWAFFYYKKIASSYVIQSLLKIKLGVVISSCDGNDHLYDFFWFHKEDA